MPIIEYQDHQISYHLNQPTQTPYKAPIALVHSAGAAPSMWHSLAQHMPDRLIIFPELYAHGETDIWSGEFGTYRMDDPAEMLEHVLSHCLEDPETPIDYVGHSYSGSMGLHLARRQKLQIQNLVLIEPTLFALLRAPGGEEALAEATPCIESVTNPQTPLEESSRMFMDYFNVDGYWEAMKPKHQDRMRHLLKHEIINGCMAQFGDDIKLEDYTQIEAKTLLLYGSQTPLGVTGVSFLLHEHLKNTTLDVIKGAGHMSPLTHREPVNKRILEFLSCL